MSVSIYLSHSIRGIKGVTATVEDMQQNCNKAIAFGKLLQERFGDCIYIPAEHEDFVGRAYEHKILTENEILGVDCLIIKDKDILAVYAPDQYISHGMMVEICFAQSRKIPVYFLFDESDIPGLESYIGGYVG